MKFSHKLVVLYSALLLVSYAVIALVVQSSTARILEGQIRIGLEEDAFCTMKAIDRMLYERYLDLRELASDPVINSGNAGAQEITQRLNAYLKNHPFFASLSLFDLDRIRIADTGGKEVGRQHPPTEYWPQIGAGEEFALTIAKSSTTGKPLLYAAHLVKDVKGSPLGVVVGRMPVEVLYEIMQKHSAKADDLDTKMMELLAGDGLILYSSYEGDAILKRVSEDWEDIKGLVGSGEVAGSDRHLWREEEEISAFSREQGYREFKGNGWILLLCTPTKTALAPVAGQRRLIFEVLLIVGGLAVVVVVVLARGMTKPLWNLSRAAREIGAGNLDVRVDMASGSVIGELAQSFNAMAAGLKAGERKYKDLVDLLPQTVYEFDDKGRLVFANQQGMSLFGYSQDDITRGLHLTQVFVPEEMGRLQGHLERTLHGEILEDIEYTARRKDGTTFPFLTFTVPVVREEAIVGMRGIGIDITGRKRVDALVRIQRDLALALSALSSLREGLDRCLDAAIRSSGLDCGGIYLVDPLSDAIDLYCSKGLSEEFLKQTSHLEPDSAKARIIMAGKPIYLPYRDLHPSMAEAELREKLRFLAVVPFGEPGRVTGCLNVASHVLDDAPPYTHEALETIAAQTGTAIDRLRAAKDLQESEKKYRDLAELLPQIVFETDINGMYTYANRHAYEISGYSPEDFRKGISALQLFVPEDWERAQENIQRRLRGEVIGGIEYTALRKDGSTFPVLLFATPIVHENRTSGLRGIAIDITERKRAERQILSAKEEWERTFDAIKDPVMILDCGHRIMRANKAMADKLHVTPDEAIGMLCYKAVHGMDHPPEFCPHAKLLADGECHDVEIYEERLSGYFHLSVSPLYTPDGVLCGSVHYAHDITEQKRADEAIRRLNEGLERTVAERTRQLLDAQEDLVRKEKLAILGQLAGSVGHELRNPLGVMSNAVYYLKNVRSATEAETVEYLDIIKDEIENAQRIIEDLLDLSRTRAPQKTTVSVPALLSGALAKCAIPGSIAVQVDIPETLPLINVDPLQMGQVFQNIIVNAVQAMAGGGALTIVAAKEREAEAVRIGVSDTGEGIRPENMSKIFQPLFTTKARGIGLGLVVSKQLIESNGGRIEVESRVGAGTTFMVILPV